MCRTITAIRVQQQRRDRASVYLDGAYAFGLQLILAARLHLGDRLTDEDIAALRQQDADERAFEATLRYLSYRPRSKREIAAYLARHQVTAAQADGVIARLERIQLVDDAAFARSWVENRAVFRPRSRWALRHELGAKGVAASDIEVAVQDIDEQEGALQVARRYARRYARLGEAMFRQRLLGALQRRGYSYAVAAPAIMEAWKDLSDTAAGDAVNEDGTEDETIPARSYRFRKDK